MTSHKGSITVVIPCYNSVNTIDRALDSVIKQSLLPEKVILIDDCSSDSTLQKLYEISCRLDSFDLEIISLSTNVGAAEARNVALRVCSTKYVAFLDADDGWQYQKLELQYDWLERHSDVFLLAHSCVVHSESFNEDRYSIQDFEKSIIPISFKQLLFKTRFSTPSVMMRCDPQVLFSSSLRYAEDYEFWLRIASQRKLIHLANIPLGLLYKAEYGSGGLSSHMSKMQYGVMKVYYEVYKWNRISFAALLFFELFSILKFVRRLFILKFR